MPTIILEREVLYREIWERPIREVAKAYGLSDVGLAKACRRLGVPRPPRGYWAKLEAGQKPRIPRLPPAKGETKAAIWIRTVEPAPQVELIPEPVIEVADNLRGMHPLVKATQADLSGAKPADFGRLDPRNPLGLDVRVSKELVPRALRVANALIRALESLGFSVEVENARGRRGTHALILGEEVPFKLWEPSHRKKEERRDPKEWYPRTLYESSGRLELSLDYYWATGSIKRVVDRPPKALVENQLGRFIVGLHTCAQAMRLQRLKREEEARQWAITRRDQERQARLAAYQNWLHEQLVLRATAHHEARIVREFLVALQGRKSQDCGEATASEWFQWAKAEADRIDPLTNQDLIIQELTPPESWVPPPKAGDRNDRW